MHNKKIIFAFLLSGSVVIAMQPEKRKPEDIVRAVVRKEIQKKEAAYAQQLEKSHMKGKRGSFTITEPPFISWEVDSAPLAIQGHRGILCADKRLWFIDWVTQDQFQGPHHIGTKSAVTALAFARLQKGGPEKILVGEENGEINVADMKMAGIIEPLGQLAGKILEIECHPEMCMIVARYLQKSAFPGMSIPCASMSVPYEIKDQKTKQMQAAWTKFLCMKCDEHAITAITFDGNHCITTFYDGTKKRWTIKSPSCQPELVQEN